MLKTGDRVPCETLKKIAADGTVEDTDLKALSARRKVVVFGLPGAFSSTCSNSHLPGFVEKAAAFRAKGIDTIYCLCVMDFFVMSAWAKDQSTGDKVLMLADGNGDFTRAAGMEIDLRSIGLGTRSQRYAMVVAGGVIEQILIEPNAGEANISAADALLARL